MRLLAASLAAVCASALLATALAFPGNGLHPAIAAVSLVAGLAIGLLAFRTTPKPATKPRLPTGWEWLPIIVFVLFSLRAFCWLIFQDDDDIKILSPNNLGDIALHITYIRYLANGAPFWPDEPIFPGHPLHYPFGADLFNSLLLLCHLNLYRGLVWTGLAGCAATGFALYEWGGAFTLAGFLFNGGLWGFAFLHKWVIKDYQADYAWKSIPLAVFVTQRGFLYALPAGLLLLISWRARLFQEKKAPIPLWLEVLLYASMPLFHVHTFIFLSLLLGCWFVMELFRFGFSKSVKSILALVLLSAAPATILIAFVSGFSSGGHLIHVLDLAKGGLWTQGNDNFFTYWFGNFGILPILVLLLAATLATSWQRGEWMASRPAAAFVFPSVLIFLFGCIVILAPWDWDNIKLLLWCYLAVLPFLWENLIRPWPLPARALACFALFFSGFISLFGGIDATHTGYDLAQRSELDPLEDVVKNLPVDAIFAGTPTYNHPLLLLGRKMVLGYTGHLWSHGYNYDPTEKKLGQLMMGDPNWTQIAADLHVRYLFWGQREEAPGEGGYPGSTQPWKGKCSLVAQGEWGQLYDLAPVVKK